MFKATESCSMYKNDKNEINVHKYEHLYIHIHIYIHLSLVQNLTVLYKKIGC